MQPIDQHLSRQYPSDVTDAQWELLAPWFDAKPRQRGTKSTVSRRQIVNAIFYLLREGCRWRSLPHDYPDWRLVYAYFALWHHRGVFAQVYEALQRTARERHGREPHPSAGLLDSQSVKTSAVARGACGYDAGKKVTGRKRHAFVDTLGLPEVWRVTGADVQDRDGGKAVLETAHAQCPRLQHGWMDGAYLALVDWAAEVYQWTLEVVKRPKDQQGFAVLPRRWVVERTFGWFTHYRRLSKDYEVWPETQVSMMHIALIHLLVRRQAA